MGALAQQVVGAILGNPSLSKAMGITTDNAADGFLASTQVYLAIIACGYVVQALGSLRREEAAGRLEPVLAGALSRMRWLAAQVLVVTTGLVALVMVSAVVFAATTALSTGDSGYLGTLLKSGWPTCRPNSSSQPSRCCSTDSFPVPSPWPGQRSARSRSSGCSAQAYSFRTGC